MEVYIKIEKNGDLIGYVTFPDEDVLGNNIEIMDSLFDAGYVITHSTKEEYDSFNGGDELSIDDIKNGNYRIDNIDDVDYVEKIS
jgi:hypothetical protein